MHIDFQKTDDLNAQLTVRVLKEDYELKYKSALNEQRKKASFKGFRKGKTPVGYLEKLFGQELLTRTVTEMLMEGVNKYLEEEKVPYIGQPLPASDQQPLAFDPKDLADDYAFKFDIGLLPDFEVKGLTDEIEWLDVPVTSDEIEQEWNALLNRHGKQVPADAVQGDARINFRFREMENLGAKLDGKESTKMIHIDMLSEAIREELMGKQVGDIIRFDPETFIQKGDMRLFKKYYFDLGEDETLADQIEAQILNITVLQPAEPNEELFSTAFEPGTVTSEEQAKEVIAKVLKQRQDMRSDAHMRHMLEHHLMDANPIALPMDFIKRLIEANRDGQDATEQEPDAEKQANAFRWHFIKDKLHKQFNIEVSQDEIVRAAADRVYDRFGNYMPYDRMEEIIKNYISDRESVEQLRSSIADSKLFFALKEQMPVVKKEISKTEFEHLQQEHKHEH